MTTRAVTVIAHRGASSYVPENTLAAFDLALRMGVHHLELDVHATSDHRIVVVHDDTIDRTTNGSGRVASHTLETLQRFDAGSWFGASFAGERIPTFEEVLERYRGKVHIHTEIKGHSADLPHRTADLVGQHRMDEGVTITSFRREPLEAIRAYAPGLPTGWLVPEASEATIVQARAMGVAQLCPRADMITAELVERLHAEGFVVRAWGVTTEAIMQRVVEAGADGMTVNFPDRAIAYLRRFGYRWA